ncbi:MAG: hypothetical protein AAFU79_36660, partial [Myxococcota bacterium]
MRPWAAPGVLYSNLGPGAPEALLPVSYPYQECTMRFHTSLPVTDVDATETFYRGLFGSDAVKRKPDYVKFLTPELN